MANVINFCPHFDKLYIYIYGVGNMMKFVSVATSGCFKVRNSHSRQPTNQSMPHVPKGFEVEFWKLGTGPEFAA